MDFFGLKEKAAKMKANMEMAKQKMSDTIIEEKSRDELVLVKVNGHGLILDLQLDESRMFPENKELLEDSILITINNALAKAEMLKKEELKNATEGIMPNIPGMDLESLGL